MADDELQGVKDFFSGTTDYNALSFIVRQIISEMINTAALVRVDSVTGGGNGAPAGTVSATPLVAQTDAQGNILPMSPIPRMPYFRYQAGKAAVIIDPVPGDQALAVFLKRDSSNVVPGTDKPQAPGSYRSFDEADGVLIGGTQNQKPTVWIQLLQNETIKIHAPAGVTIESDGPVKVNGSTATITASTITLNGTVTVNGTLTTTGNITGNGLGLNTHKHSGVDTGSGTSGGPVANT